MMLLRSTLTDWHTGNAPAVDIFFWLRIHDSVDTGALRTKTSELETGFQYGATFSNKGELSNCLRLCFAHYNVEDIQKGIARMRPLFNDAHPVTSALDGSA